MSELATKLGAFPQFKELAPDELQSLVDALDIRHHAAGDVLLREGEPGDSFFVVVEGRVHVVREIEGPAPPPLEHGPGSLLGLMSLVDDGARSATVVATTEATLAWLPAAAFHLLHDGSPRLSVHFRKLIARQLARDARALNAAFVRAMLELGAHPDDADLSGEFHLSIRKSR